MPEGPRRASSEAAQQEPAARLGAIARPEEVSTFRMTRRKRGSSAAKAPLEPEQAPADAVKATIAEPAAPSSSPAEVSEDDDAAGELARLCWPLLGHVRCATAVLLLLCCAALLLQTEVPNQKGPFQQGQQLCHLCWQEWDSVRMSGLEHAPVC